METNVTQRVQLVVASIKPDKKQRLHHIHGQDGEKVSIPFETDIKKRFFKGHLITYIEYQEQGAVFKKVQLGEQIAAQYGPAEKFRRDEYYRVEVSGKAALL